MKNILFSGMQKSHFFYGENVDPAYFIYFSSLCICFCEKNLLKKEEKNFILSTVNFDYQKTTKERFIR